MELQELLNGYRKHLERCGVRTNLDYHNTALRFAGYLHESNHDLHSATTAIAEEYRRELLSGEKPLAKGTVNNIMARLKSFFAFLLDKGIRADNPFCDLEAVPTGLQLPRQILEPEQIGLLLDGWACERNVDVMLKSVAELLYGSSLRIGEAVSLKLDDILFDEGSLYVTDHKAGRRMKRPASDVSLKTLSYYLANVRVHLTTESDEGFLYPQACTTQLRCLLNAKLKRECLRHGLPVITSHSFRHSSATHLLRAGAGIRQVQMMLGHESIGSTQRYTRVLKEDLKAVIAACHPRERKLSTPVAV